MLRAFHNRIHGARKVISPTAESVVWTAGFLMITILVIVILFFGVFLTRVS
jgi:hypothetical protein